MLGVSHPEADEELEAAALWYEERQPGLGEAFLEQFERTLRRIVAQPERWRRIGGDNRKRNFHRFPYPIVYSVQADILYIKAVMHLHRRPFYWAVSAHSISVSGSGTTPRSTAMSRCSEGSNFRISIGVSGAES